MILGIQFFLIAFGLLMVYLTFLHYKRREFNRTQFLFWEFIWISFLFTNFFPRTISNFVQKFGFLRLLDFLTITSLIFITFLTFYNYTALNKIKKNLEERIRKESLKNLNK